MHTMLRTRARGGSAERLTSCSVQLNRQLGRAHEEREKPTSTNHVIHLYPSTHPCPRYPPPPHTHTLTHTHTHTHTHECTDHAGVIARSKEAPRCCSRRQQDRTRGEGFVLPGSESQRAVPKRKHGALCRQEHAEGPTRSSGRNAQACHPTHGHIGWEMATRTTTRATAKQSCVLATADGISLGLALTRKWGCSKQDLPSDIHPHHRITPAE